MPMKNPPHPGRSIKDACLEPLELSVTEGAKVLGVTRNTLSRVINGESGISPEMGRSGWRRPDGPTPTTGCACKPPTNWPKRARSKIGSRSSATSCGWRRRERISSEGPRWLLPLLPWSGANGPRAQDNA